MINKKIIKLKKYLFLISVLFLVFTLTHLIYKFIYEDSKLIPISGGTISEGLVGKFPSFNPLKPLKGNNKYMISLLYRSLLKYDLNENKIVSDLVSCDISNLLSIECYLKDNIYWSNGERITVEDIISTYNLLKNTSVHKVASSLLENTEIIQNDNIITFKNKKEDINFLNIFFQPILSKQIIDSIGNDTIFGNFPTHGQIYSGNYKISNISSDQTIGITKIVLEVNEYNKNSNINQLEIKLFPNTNSLLQNKETINIFNDNEKIIGKSIPRLESYKYTLPQYVSIFLNKNNIKDINLRNYILSKINTDNLIKLLGEDNFSNVSNPYLTQTSINKTISNKNFEKIIENLGYIKKSKILDNYLPNKETYSNEVSIEDLEKTKKEELEIIIKNIDEKNINIDKFQKDSKYIVKPTYVDKYNFITKDNILLEGNAGKNVTDIYINDYKLTNYTSTDSKFYYRIKESYNTIKEGENNYKIYFVENGEKKLKEEINFLFYKNKLKLNEESTKYITILYIEEEKEKINNKKPKKIEKIEIQIDKEKLKQLSNLDEKYYYNNNLEKFKLNIYYISSEKELEETAFFIQNTLYEIGIDIELFPITLNELSLLLKNKDNYDMLLTGVNLGYFDYNIFPYFHSSQVKNGYNFSNIKKTSLDILLEDLKSEIKTDEDKNIIKEKILNILKEEQIIKTLYTPKIDLLIDKNIKNININNKLINKSDRNLIYKDIYIKEEKIINLTNKGFFNFFKYLFEKLNG